ncbi:unnamed protein product, partial [Hapterophycus canaliculatus]
MNALCGIAGQVHEELYRLFVQRMKEVNMVSLRYPEMMTKMTRPRAKVLYFVAGWLLSKVWKHVRRRNIKEKEWMDIVDHKKHPNGQTAVETEGVLEGLVEEVQRRNDEVNGAGLLFVKAVFFELVYCLEVGYFHVLSQPRFLGAYLGDLPGELLRVVSEATKVKESWVPCCPPGAEPTVAHEVFMFILHKWHNCRMGDYTRRVSEVSSIRRFRACSLLGEGFPKAPGLRRGEFNMKLVGFPTTESSLYREPSSYLRAEEIYCTRGLPWIRPHPNDRKSRSLLGRRQDRPGTVHGFLVSSAPTHRRQRRLRHYCRPHGRST